jgi:hypothetical protein
MGFSVSEGETRQFLTELQIAPHETRAINLRKLRDTQRGDFKGRKIPANARDGVVHWLRLDNVPVAGRVVIINRKSGLASNYDCCFAPCPPNYVGMDSLDPSPASVAVNGYVDIDGWGGYYDCNNGYYCVCVTGPASWSTGNSSVAASQGYGEVLGVAIGSTFAQAIYTDCGDWRYDEWNNCYCNSPYQGSGYTTVNVVTATVTITGGNNFALWGSDPNVLAFNIQMGYGSPSGGSYSWSVNPSRVSLDNPTSPSVTLTAQSPSTALLDTQLTLNYTYNQTAAAPATKYITVRIYKYLAQLGQVQVISLNGPSQYGYLATAYYLIFTNPGGQLVPSYFSNVPTYETVTVNSVTPSGYSVTLYQGGGATYSDSEIHDNLSILVGSPLPQNFHINASQDLFVSNIYVRNNTLDWYPSGPVITNNGPFN